MSKVSNDELIQKAVITTDAIASAGKLNPAQSEKFLDYVVDQTVLRNNARIIRFREESLEIDKIGIGRRVTFPKVEAQDPGLRRGVTTSKVTLTPRTVITPFEISDEFREINLEGDAIENTIIQLMARQVANDLEELFLFGDTTGPAILESDYRDGGDATKYVKDSFLALFNGWNRLADSGNLYDAAGANIGLSVFGSMLRSMPTKFRRNRGDLRFFMSPDLAQLYYEKLSTRATALGDSSAGGATQRPFGIPIVEVPLMQFLPQVVQHITLAGTTPVSLRYAPVNTIVVTPSTLGASPVTPYLETTDWHADYTAGTIHRESGGAITDGQVVKVTYTANPQVILTHMQNFIVGLGRDIRIEKDRDIYKGVNQYAITTKIATEFEESTALVKGKNIGSSV